MSEKDSNEVSPTDAGAEQQPSEVFIQALTDHQAELRGFIAASLGGASNAAEVLQRTNLTLWKRANEFNDSQPFLPWAIAFARFEVLGFWRDAKRSRISFSTDVVELMCATAEQVVSEVPDRLAALEKCLEKVPAERQSLLSMRYGGGLSLREIADRKGKSIDSVKSVLKRMRSALADCISREVSAQQR